MPALLIEDSSPLMPVEEEDSEDYEYSLSLDDTGTSDNQDDDEYVNDGAIGNSLRYIDSTTIRLPSGKTISHRPDAGFRKSKSRSHKSLSTTSASASRTQKKLRGNCAMISSSSTPSQKVSRTSATSSDHDHESTSSDSDATTPAPNSSALLPTNTQSSALNNRVRAISHKTLRASDMQMMASLPATRQRALMATQQRSVSRSSRADHKFRGKMGAFGNIKMTERFIIDVPFGNRHKCRFPV